MIAIIQARTGSKRLKNKVLIDVNKKPLIWYVINQVKKAKNVKKIIIAIPKKNSNDRLYQFLKNNNNLVFRGNEKNVADRMVSAAKEYNAKYFVRISGDSPLINPKLIDKLIKEKKKYLNYDIITNVFPRSFASGQSVEIIRTKILEKNIRYMKTTEKEHVTIFFYKNYKNYKIKNVFNISKKKQIKNSVDTKYDLKKLRHLIK
ncbi:NTP transferase domain-containing protein [Candidatus Pelagibacter sp.]|nr:NTP transferase domain-containing protein [Candidatus Pelagibacter sp.]